MANESYRDELLDAGNRYADIFRDKLVDNHIDFSTGVPCGVLKHFIKNVSQNPLIIHCPAQQEPESLGIATGAYLAGKKPIVYMQNSGFLKSVNDIGSLILPYEIPVLFLVSYRGCSGETAPQHLKTGEMTKPIIELMHIAYHEVSEESFCEDLDDAVTHILHDEPSLLLLRRGILSDGDYRMNGKRIRIAETFSGSSASYKRQDNNSEEKIMDLRRYDVSRICREDAIDTIVSSLKPDDAMFTTTGLISRSVYERYDMPNYFYNTGSFGMVSSEGLGFAISRPDIRTIVVDGDASILTNMGSLATIGHHKPRNLMHIVLDNESYGSCSEEKSLSQDTRISRTAKVNGYEKVYVVDNKDDLCNILCEEHNSLTMIHAKISLGGRRDFKRPSDLKSLTRRFKDFFNKSQRN